MTSKDSPGNPRDCVARFSCHGIRIAVALSALLWMAGPAAPGANADAERSGAPADANTSPPAIEPGILRIHSARAGGDVFALAGGAAVACAGDCNNDAQITVDELLTMVNIALGDAPVLECAAGDGNGDAQITVDEILTAVAHALVGCPVPPTPTPTQTATPTSSSTPVPGQRTVLLAAGAITDCDHTTANISIDDATGIIGFDLALRYDPTVVRTSAVESAPAQPLSSCLLGSRIDNVSGTVTIGLACLATLIGPSDLVVIAFEAVANGTTALELTRCSLDEDRVPCAASHGSMTVSGCPAP